MTASAMHPLAAVVEGRRWRTIGLTTFTVAAFLLLSMGGAIAASPASLPLMYVATRKHPTRAFRNASMVIGGLTAAEAAWALTYLTVGEATSWTWLIPMVTAAAAMKLYATAPGRDREPAVA